MPEKALRHAVQSADNIKNPMKSRLNCPAHTIADPADLLARLNAQAPAGLAFARAAVVPMKATLGRLPTEDEVASAILFMASDLSSGITGQALDVNCGEYKA